MTMPKFKFRAGIEKYVAWYLLPTFRFSHEDRRGFLAFTWLKFDACLQWNFTGGFK